jgi:hypothetical protein
MQNARNPACGETPGQHCHSATAIEAPARAT